VIKMGVGYAPTQVEPKAMSIEDRLSGVAANLDRAFQAFEAMTAWESPMPGPIPAGIPAGIDGGVTYLNDRARDLADRLQQFQERVGRI
jgi:hypothetical protein